MRILIDALSARAGGGVTYIQQILRALLRNGSRHSYNILLSRGYQRSLIESLPAGIEPLLVDLPAEPLAKRWWFQQTELPKLLLRHRFDLFYAVADGSYLRMPTPFVMLARNPGIYMDVDMSNTQSSTPSFYRLARQPLVYLALLKADRVGFVSETFRDQVTRQMHVNVDKTRVVYHGISPIFAQRANQALEETDGQPYLLAVSSINPHKNYETLVRAYARLPADTPPLLIAGEPLHAPTVQNLRMIVAQERLEARVRFLGKVAYDDLPALYQGATAFIFPSRRETFGHPLVEAMASGTPIIASALPVCREICQDAALYFEPLDIDTLVANLHCVLSNGQLRASLITQGRQRAGNFSWDVSARQLISIFEELV
jgi:glycosyltransferase involved in cell wall biosynthesis